MQKKCSFRWFLSQSQICSLKMEQDRQKFVVILTSTPTQAVKAETSVTSEIFLDSYKFVIFHRFKNTYVGTFVDYIQVHIQCPQCSMF
jgi:hypothetical protein